MAVLADELLDGELALRPFKPGSDVEVFRVARIGHAASLRTKKRTTTNHGSGVVGG